jgi:hypothetical protein
MRALWLVVLASCSVTPGAPSPSAVVRQADCGQASDETVRIMAGLAPVCAGCHSVGPRGFFSSVAAFQSLIVANPAWVTPGDPDHSELIRLLEGNGTGPFKQMPIGTTTYAQLVAAGTATIPLSDVRAWVTGLTAQARDARPDSTAPTVARLRTVQLQRALYQQLGLTHDDFFGVAQDFGITRAESRGDDLYPLQPPDGLPEARQTEPVDRAVGLGAGSNLSQRRDDPNVSPTFVLTLTQVSQRWCRLALAKPGNVALFPSGTLPTPTEANARATIRRWFLHFHGTIATDAQVDELYQQVWTPLTVGGPADAGWVGLCSAFLRHPSWIFY